MLEELVKRLLIRFFKDKGFSEPFDNPVYPPIMFDVPFRIPELITSVEIVPYVDRMDPITNVVTIGWNLFVLGTNRMDLGTSTHPNLMEFRRSLMGFHNPNLPSEMKKTPRDIIDFIMSIVSRNKGSILEMPPGVRIPAMAHFLPPLGLNKPMIGPTMSGSWYEKNRPVY
jgi:hypothetical protein